MPERMVYENSSVEWSCTRKRAYPTEKLAQKVAAHLRSENLADVVAYGCTHCGRYHLGRPPGG